MSELPSEHLPEETLQEYLDGELSPKEQSRVEIHLKDCVVCTARLESWSGLFAEIEQLPELEQTIDFEPLVLAQLRAQGSSRYWETWILVVQIALTMLLLGYGWQKLAEYIPLDEISRWLTQPFQTLQSMISRVGAGLVEAFRQYLAWSFSNVDLIVRAPRITHGETFLIYVVLLAIGLWVVCNHYLLRTNGQSEDIRP